jgi:hypothetical protein
MDRSQPPNGLTPSERVLRARMAAHISWAKTDDRSARTAPARKAALARFEEQVDPDGRLSPTERARRAEHAQRAHMTRLALRSAQARRRASAHGPGPSDPDTKKPA